VSYLQRCAWRTGLAAVLVSIPLATLPSTATAASPDLASGSDWNVTQAPGGYLVTVDLDEALPIKSDAPTIEVDGAPIGIATESADGKSLSVFTTDASVVKADDAEAGWFSSPSGGASSKRAAAVPDDIARAAAAPLAENPAAIGSYQYTESVYDFGTQSVPLAGMPLAPGGIRGELQGKMYLPTTGGARPTVVLLHGRHTSCSPIVPPTQQNPAPPANPDRWPCAKGYLNVPSFAGYDGTARALASQGYAVVSIAANAINSNDNQLALDQGAQARGQLLLDTLSMLDKANKGQPVSYYDAQKKKDVSLDDALANQSALPGLASSEATTPIRPAGLVGKFDLTTIGMMGHSRGGEGVTSAATLNQGLAKPWGIKSILPLAPVDFSRATVPDVAMNVILPYCDGDVSNQQGQHMLDDSRYAFDDDVLRSGVWAMGANHNFFNSVWTPGVYSYSTSDDWSGTSPESTNARDTVCGTNPAVTSSIRMTPKEQYDTGTAYMAGWFRLTLGGEKQFLPMFDGSGTVPAVLNGEDVRSMSTAPSSARKTITTFESTSSLVRTVGAASATVCASAFGRTVPQPLPACTTSISTSATPHWTPASNGGNVPATPVTKMAWTALSTGTTTQTPSEVRVSVPAPARNASGSERLSFKTAADESVTTGTDLTLSVIDGKGVTYSSKVSALNPLAVNRLPASTSAILKKIVLQQVNVPTASLTAAGLDLSDIREVRFAAATGADTTPTGAVYLSDLAFESSSVGTPVVKTEPTIDVFTPAVEEGDGPGTADVAVYLNGPTKAPVTGYVSVLGSATGRGGIAMEKVTFSPGEVCKVVTAPILGDNAASTSNSTLVKASVINTSGAVQGKKSLGNILVREDDGIALTPPTATNPNPPVVPELPAVGAQGNVCAEAAALSTPGAVTVDGGTIAPGATVVLTATGYRAGETVTFSLDGKVLGTATADAAGKAVLSAVLPADVKPGSTVVTAVGSGSGFTSEGALQKNASGTSLVLGSDSAVYGSTVRGFVTVSGADSGTVTVTAGGTSSTVPVGASGTASFTLPADLAVGSYTVKAVYNGSDAVKDSSATAAYRVTRKATAASLSAKSSVKKGKKLAVRTTVRGATAGTYPTGTVKVYVKTSNGTYSLKDTVRLRASDRGVVSTSVKVTRKKATIRVKAVYSGDGNYAGDTTASKGVRVK
jgi:hypothetical protein